MNNYSKRRTRFDVITILLFFILVGFGWLNILSASAKGNLSNVVDISEPFGKQLVFIILTVVLIIIILTIEAKFYERFASIFYIASLLSLVGLFIFGKNVNGAISWYSIGGFTIQPSEFAKFATALAVAKHIGDINFTLDSFKNVVSSIVIISLPALLILLQNDTGSTLVYYAFFFVFFREGINSIYLAIAIFSGAIAIFALKFGETIAISVLIGILILYFFLIRKNKQKEILKPILFFISGVIIAVGVNFFYTSVLKKHQKDRITIWLSLEKNPVILKRMKRDIAYNLNESEKAISSGGFMGKGYLDGTRTTGKFVPEQHTDYIFTTVGEEWGFVGSSAVVIVFVLLILRVLYLAETQKSRFSRIYGYSVASILFIHFTINIGMVMGLIPTIGIPLPFFSYGGSGLWAFTILLFIFVKLDSNKVNEL